MAIVVVVDVDVAAVVGFVVVVFPTPVDSKNCNVFNFADLVVLIVFVVAFCCFLLIAVAVCCYRCCCLLLLLLFAVAVAVCCYRCLLITA